MINKTSKKLNLYWITSLCISCTIPFIACALLFLMDNIKDSKLAIILWFILVLLIQLTAIVLSCYVFVSSQNNTQKKENKNE